MLVTELMPIIRELSREEKQQLMEFIQSELEQEDIMPFQPGVSYPVWSPYEAHEAAQILSKILHSERRGNCAMETLANYRQIMERILTEYSLIPYSIGELERKLIIDRASNHYLLMTVGWEGKKRAHGCLVHLEIIDGKIWVQRDGTEDGIATELVAAGIPKDSIVLAFHPPYVRPHTEFAVG